MQSARQEIMMALSLPDGSGFEFAIDTMAHQKLAATYEWRWPKADLLGGGVARQFTGQGDRTITLDGVIYPHVGFGRAAAIDEIRELADRGQPFAMADGAGNISGPWTVEKFEPTYSALIGTGLARKVEFKIQLGFFGEDPSQ